jgi:hypothetical protein
MLTSVYLNCWGTRGTMAWQILHWNDPVTSSGCTVDVLTTVPEDTHTNVCVHRLYKHIEIKCVVDDDDAAMMEKETFDLKKRAYLFCI